ncbi:MAG: hypothetical protein WC716_15780 [Chitinophagaceae bacterium]|jgi:hypothetical protein
MFVLHIPELCHENWNEMTPESKGRFCGSCQKTVVDFTKMSDEQVKNYLLDKKNKNTCGRFYATQIGRPLENQSINIDPVWYRHLPFTKQIFYAVAVFFVLGVSSCDFNSTTTGDVRPDTTIFNSPVADTNKMVGDIAMDEQDTLPPPKVEMINHPGPILTGDVAIGVPDREITQRAPIWQEEPAVMDTVREMMGKIAVPPQPEIDTVKPPKPMIMGGIAVPIQNQPIEDKKNHAK